MDEFLGFSLDELFGDGFIYSDHSVSNDSHYIVIRKEDKEAFLDEYAKKFRDKVESMLEEAND